MKNNGPSQQPESTTVDPAAGGIFGQLGVTTVRNADASVDGATFDPSALTAVTGQGQGIVLGEPGIGKTIALPFNTQELERIRELGRSRRTTPVENTVQFQSNDLISMPDHQFPTTRVVR